MNIAAYMAACDIGDLDHEPTAKLLVEKIAGRANHPDGVAVVSYGRVATDLAVSLPTARRAARIAVNTDYLTVENRPGRTPVWRLNLARLGVNPERTWKEPGKRLGGTERKTGNVGSGSGGGSQSPPRFTHDGADDLWKNGSEHPKAKALAARVADLCVGTDRRAVQCEADALTAWALGELDWRPVDEIVGAALQWETRPTLPRALTGPIRQRARETGARLGPFRPGT
jgi:hypothetical protein